MPSIRARAVIAVFAAVSMSTAAIASGDVYINQLDSGGGPAVMQHGGPAQPSRQGAPAYIEQMPMDARPAPPPRPQRARQVRRAAPAPKEQAVASRTGEVPAVIRLAYPNVGAGVTLALAAGAADNRFPSVGRGVVRP